MTGHLLRVGVLLVQNLPGEAAPDIVRCLAEDVLPGLRAELA